MTEPSLIEIRRQFEIPTTPPIAQSCHTSPQSCLTLPSVLLRAPSRDPSVRHFSTRSGTAACPTSSSSRLSVSASASSSQSFSSSGGRGPPLLALASEPVGRTRSATSTCDRRRGT